MLTNKRPIAIIRRSCSDSSVTASQWIEFSEATGSTRRLRSVMRAEDRWTVEAGDEARPLFLFQVYEGIFSSWTRHRSSRGASRTKNDGGVPEAATACSRHPYLQR